MESHFRISSVGLEDLSLHLQLAALTLSWLTGIWKCWRIQRTNSLNGTNDAALLIDWCQKVWRPDLTSSSPYSLAIPSQCEDWARHIGLCKA